MNLKIIGHNVAVTEAMRAILQRHLDGLKIMLDGAANVVVRICGQKKNGWAQKVRVEAHFKGRIVAVEKFLCRRIGDFYDNLNKVMEVFCVELKEKKRGRQKAMRRDRTLTATSKYAIV